MYIHFVNFSKVAHITLTCCNY